MAGLDAAGRNDQAPARHSAPHGGRAEQPAGGASALYRVDALPDSRHQRAVDDWRQCVLGLHPDGQRRCDRSLLARENWREGHCALVRNFGQSTAPDDWGLQAMHSILGLLDRFRRDERGAFAVVFAVIAIVLVAMSGAVVDFTSMQQSRTRAQVALDAAALALQPRIYDTAAGTIHDEAQNLLINRLADQATTWKDCAGAPAPCVSVGTPTLDTVHGQLTLTATLKVPMNFVSLVGVPTLTAQLVSVATRKKLNLEVAMTLDNSGSMAYAMGYNKVVSGLPTRMDVLKDAATCATNILFYGTASCSASTTGLSVNPNVKMGLVPFTEAVNVGTANASATWI